MMTPHIRERTRGLPGATTEGTSGAAPAALLAGSPAHHVRILPLCSVSALYLVVTLLVILPSPLVSFDHVVAAMHLKGTHPSLRPWIRTYELLGQRGPATLAFLPYFGWAAWRRHTLEPLILLATALVVLNVSVGIVKYSVGRVGPFYSSNAHAVFAGGDIYPSGHVSNAVVLYGCVALTTLRWRRSAAGAAVLISVTVGLGAVYLRTHWVSDVLGGWLAGGLVLLVLPAVLPSARRGTRRALGSLRGLTNRRQHRRPTPGSKV